MLKYRIYLPHTSYIIHKLLKPFWIFPGGSVCYHPAAVWGPTAVVGELDAIFRLAMVRCWDDGWIFDIGGREKC